MRNRLYALSLLAALASCKTTDQKPGGDPAPVATAKTTDAALIPGSDGVPAMRKPVCADADACKTACDKGGAKECLRLGYLLRNGSGVNQSLTEARAIYDKTCNAGNGRACVRLADMLQKGIGGLPEPDRSQALYEQACTTGEGSGCRNAAIAHFAGIGRPRDAKAATAIFAKAQLAYRNACDGGDSLACAELGLLLEKGFGSKADPVRGVKLYKKACDAGEPDGCHKLANVLIAGKHLPAAPDRAMRLLESACVADFGPACNQIGVYYMRGTEAIGVDFGRAYHYFGMACAAGHAPGCGTRAELVMAGKIEGVNPGTAIGDFERSCILADSTGCFRLGQMMRGAPSPENDQKAATYFGRACDVGMGRACAELAAMVEDPKEAKKLKDMACRLGDKISCH